MKRPWYRLPVAFLGLALIVVGSAPSVLVYSIGAPMHPQLPGLMVSGLGAWFLLGHRFFSLETEPGPHHEE